MAPAPTKPETYLVWDNFGHRHCVAVHDGVHQDLRVAPELVAGVVPDQVTYRPALGMYQVADASNVKTRPMTKAEMAGAQSYLERMAAGCRAVPYIKRRAAPAKKR